METGIISLVYLKASIGLLAALVLVVAALAGPLEGAGAAGAAAEFQVRLEVTDSVSVDIRGGSDPAGRVLRFDDADSGEVTYVVLDG